MALSTTAATLLACAVLLPMLGRHVLAEWDEGIYAEVAREMLGGSWFVPHWNAQVWMEKPPLEMWLTAACFKVFGVSEFWARAVSAFAGVATVGVLHAWLQRRASALAAWIASVVLLANFGFQHAARAGETDVLLALGCLVSVIGLAELSLAPERAVRGWLLFWCGFGAALMTKGAASLVLLPTLVVFWMVERPRPVRGGRAFAVGLAAFLAIVLPWHLYMLARFGGAFVHVYFGWQVLDRAAHAIEGHYTHAWYYLGVLLVVEPLVSLVFPVALVEALRRDWLRPVRAFAVFALVALFGFSCASTRLPHYIVPAYPALAAVTAAWGVDALRRAGFFERSRPVRIGAAGAAVALFVFACVMTIGERRQLHSPKLADGSLAPDARESAALLKQVFRTPQATPGPLLLWRPGRFVPIASSIFYSRRPVQQVELEPVPTSVARDPYTFDPVALRDAVKGEQRMILLDSSFAAAVPAKMRYTVVAKGKTLEMGVIGPR